MRAEAMARDDEWIHQQADLVEWGIVSHWYGWSEGCSTCHGHLHQCPDWGQAQITALTWLARKAGLLP